MLPLVRLRLLLLFRHRRPHATWPALAALVGALVFASGADARLDLKGVATFDAPTYLTAPPGDGDRKYVTERAGTIRVLAGGRKLRRPFLDIRDDVSTRSENGLHSMAFHPNYRENGKFFVYYVDNGHDIRVDQFKAPEPNRARRSSRQRIIEISSPPDTHKGGQVVAAPDGYLLLATGDGGDFQNPSHDSQRKGSLRGKLLRILPQPGRPPGEPQYAPHPDNPYVGDRKGNGAILARGLRNPWRFSLDSANPQRLVLGDVGHERTEEINRGTLDGLAGANFGWPCFEGRQRLLDCRARNHRPPRLTYPHSGGKCSITGGFVNRAPNLPGKGDYFFGDYCTGRIFRADLDRKRKVRTALSVDSLVSFGEDAQDRLYAISLNGAVKRIVSR